MVRHGGDEVRRETDAIRISDAADSIRALPSHRETEFHCMELSCFTSWSPNQPERGGCPFRDSVFVCFLLVPSDRSIQRTSPSLFRKCTSHTLAARVAILLPFFPHHVGLTPSFSAPSFVRCHQSTPSARCIGCRSLPHGTHLSCAQLENRKGVGVSTQPHQPTPHLLHVILHST